MARKIPRHLAQRSAAQVADDDPALLEARARHGAPLAMGGGEGGAWAQAAGAVMSSELGRLQRERLERLLSGDLVVELDPAQIDDEVGSDRSAAWTEDEAFEALKDSIDRNGQDAPIQVAPVDPAWRPTFDETDGFRLEGARFKIISGRRRLEALRRLGRKARAVILRVSQQDATFDQLHRRFRENVERENLTFFEELLAIGELYERARVSEEGITGRALAQLLHVGEPKVSRARAVYENRERVFREIPEPRRLTLHQLDALIPALRAGARLPPLDFLPSPEHPVPAGRAPVHRTPSSEPTLRRMQIIRGRKIAAKAKGGKITLDLGEDAMIDEGFLDRLLLFLQQDHKR